MAESCCQKKWVEFDQFLKGCFADEGYSFNHQPLEHRIMVQVNSVSSEKHNFFTFDNVSDSDVPMILEGSYVNRAWGWFLYAKQTYRVQGCFFSDLFNSNFFKIS